MKFAHLADIHIGGWREEQLKSLNLEVFRKAIETCIEQNTAFVLISGDLFNTALPSIELIKETASILNQLKENDIDCYIIPGSHDFSPSGKTMLDVLEKAGLVTNVVKFSDNKLQFTIDKTNTKITGLFGKKGSLDKLDYESLDKSHLESEKGFKIFMFHNLLTELKTKNLEKADSLSIDLLPKNFNYYAGGHPHIVSKKEYSNGIIVYPGALFPNNFQELEEFQNGGFYILDDKLNMNFIPVKLKEVVSIKINIDNLTPDEAEERIRASLKNNFENKIVTLRIEGTLKSGKPSDIKLKELISKINCYILLKNTSKLTSKEFEEIQIESGNVDEVENKIIKEHLSNLIENEESVIQSLLKSLAEEKHEGEKVIDFEKRIIKNVLEVIK